MNIGAFAFVTIVLFMVHEFEEIVFIRPYIDRHLGDERYESEIFIAGANHYPSTEAIAAMISEEFVVASLVLLTGIVVGSIEVVAATFIAYALHLIAHIRDALAFPGWAPGSRTAVFTMPLVLVALYAMLTMHTVNYLLLTALTAVIGRRAPDESSSHAQADNADQGVLLNTPCRLEHSAGNEVGAGPAVVDGAGDGEGEVLIADAGAQEVALVVGRLEPVVAARRIGRLGFDYSCKPYWCSPKPPSIA